LPQAYQRLGSYTRISAARTDYGTSVLVTDASLVIKWIEFAGQPTQQERYHHSECTKMRGFAARNPDELDLVITSADF